MFGRKIKATIICIEGAQEVYNSYTNDEMCNDYFDDYLDKHYEHDFKRIDSYFIYRVLKIKYEYDGKEVISEVHNTIRSKPLTLHQEIFIKIKEGVVSIV